MLLSYLTCGFVCDPTNDPLDSFYPDFEFHLFLSQKLSNCALIVSHFCQGLRLVSHRSHLWHKFCKECHPSCHIIFCCACLEPFLEYIYSRSRLAWIFLASPDTTLLFWHCYSLSHNWVRQLFPCLTPIHFKRDPLGISSLFERHTVSFIEFWSKNTQQFLLAGTWPIEKGPRGGVW